MTTGIIVFFAALFIILMIVLGSKKEPNKTQVYISDNAWRWIKIILILIGLFIAYLYVLNERYERDSQKWDKWKNSYIESNRSY